jgi:hypothetical protein
MVLSISHLYNQHPRPPPCFLLWTQTWPNWRHQNCESNLQQPANRIKYCSDIGLCSRIVTVYSKSPENRLFRMIRFTFICNYSKPQIPSGAWKTVIVAPTGSPLGNLVKPQLLSRIGGIFHAMFDNPMGYECSCSGWITNEDFSSPDVFLDPLIHGCWGVLRQPNGPYLF